MSKKLWDGLFLAAVLLVLTAGLLRAAFAPKDVNTYENRYAEKLPSLTAESWMDGSFQDGVDAALADQVQLAEFCKKLYNTAASAYMRAAAEALVPEDSGRYINYDGTLMFGDYLTYDTAYLPWGLPLYDTRVENLNTYFAAHPEIDFYVYYIEKDSDIDFETGEKAGIREYVLEHLALPAERKAAFMVDSFDEFAANFYKTDHHWNADGSYRGYTELLALLGVEEAPLSPLGEAEAVGAMSGSKATGSASGFSETFYAYRYAFPAMQVWRNGVPAEDYGAQAAYLDHPGGGVTYGDFYGGDDGEAVLSTGTSGRGSILLVGESFDNALLKLLASHYDALYAVDLRYFGYYFGAEFRLADYARARGIDKVLLIGNIDYFRSSDFNLTEG